MKKLAIAVMLMCSCTDEPAARKTLESEGWRDIELTGHEFFACSKSDDSCTGFKATHPISGQRVTGAVGCGWFGCSKGCTVRVRP